MPSRWIREGLLASTAIERAGGPGGGGAAAQMLFVRLLLVADDYGRFNGRHTVIERTCWPNAGPDTPNHVELEAWLTALANAKDARGVPLIQRYEVDGEPFLVIPKFGQRTRAKKSKYPAPPQVNPQNGAQPPTNDGHVTGNRQADAGQLPDGWRAPDGHPQAVSVIGVSVIDGEHARHATGRRRTRETPGVRRAQEVLAQGREAELHATEPPGGSVAALAASAGIRLPRIPTEPDPTDWSASSDSIDQKGASLGMQRMKLEGDDEYVTRINARIQLG